ncbi:MAG: Peptidase T [Synergistetes bacterium ADurb.BinA166]|nr:MAG: Peptidase T [Synergistetes bacterium ADurb.BinA166]
MSSVLDRFVKYVQIPTQADSGTAEVPSTPGQMTLARELVEELKAIGLKDAAVDERAYVTASLPGNTPGAPAIGFLAHLDTALEVTDDTVRPRLVENYGGGEIVLSADGSVVLSPSTFPDLLLYKGQTLVVTDGTTLLGADDKAGIAEIMAALEHLVAHPEIPRGDVKVAFTPDEEIGHGAKLLDLEKFGADFAYTIDGGAVGEMSYETFNAAKARITIHGRSVHPGKSKNKMVNSILLGMELAAMLPPDETPARTEGYEGFYHLMNFNGNVETTVMEYIIRDHSAERFAERKNAVEAAVSAINDRHGAGRAELEMSDQYYNMLDKIKPQMHIVETAMEAMRQVGLEPKIIPVRGGTDGSQLSCRGLLTPNIFTGAHNAHGKHEFIPVPSMEKAVEVILKIVELYATK